MFALIAILAVLIALYLVSQHFDKQAKKAAEKPNPFDGKTELPYTRRPIMTATELQVYDLLLENLPNYMIFPQVQVSRVIESPQEKNLYWFNFINRLSYDFVICRPDGTPIVAIEIDDATHEIAARQQADTRKDLATVAAGISMLRWQVNELPNGSEIAEQIRQLDREWS